jgi:hypothetical protein
MEYWGLKGDVSLFLISALDCPYKKQISFHQTQYSNTPLSQYPMSFTHGKANLLWPGLANRVSNF